MTPPKLLLVDDEPAVLEGLTHAFRPEPYRILRAESGRAALALVKEHRLAAVISDERMPGMSGAELLAEIRRVQPAAVRILLTGHASLTAAIRCINEAQVACFLEKPVDAPVLRATLAAALAPAPPSSAADGPVGAFSASALAALSRREREVFDLLVAGRRLAQITQQLHISPHTARNHLKAIFAKLDVHSQAELLDQAS